MTTMQQINDEQLTEIVGGGDPITQPLNMPPGWKNQPQGLPPWVTTVSDYLKYLGIAIAQ